MGFEFLARVRRVTLALTILTALATTVYVDFAFGLAFFLGSLWSLANLLWLEAGGRLTLAALTGKGLQRGDVVKVLAGAPLLPLAGFALLLADLPILALSLGFWLLFAVIVLKALGVLLAKALDYSTGRSQEAARDAVRRPLPSRRSMGLVGWGVFAVIGATFVVMALASPDTDDAHGGVDADPATKETAAEDETAMEAAEEWEHPEEHGDEHGTAGAHGDGHGGEHGDGHGEGGVPHLPTLTGILHNAFPGNAVVDFIYKYEDIFFALLAGLLLIVLFQLGFASPKLFPGKGQTAVEAVAGGMRDFLVTTFGPHMAKFAPFIGTLFLYILVMNWMGMVPLLKSSTASLNTTAALAIIVFLYSIFTAIRTQGLFGYLHHLAGSPKDILGWIIALILFPIELMGELIKPISLACRLFGNIFGEDLLVAVFVGIGATLMAWQPVPVGIPMQLPFVFLALTLSAVQALVFALLAAVYLHMAQPHHEEAHEEVSAESPGDAGPQTAHA